MNESIFSKVFSYRQRDNHTPLENFLTEILSFCIEYDLEFRNDFLNKVLGIKYIGQEISISTQEIYSGYGRPDIEINFGNTCIIIECKIGAIERQYQLTDYASLLAKEKPKSNKHLVYLTKYYDHKNLEQSNMKFHQKRWFEIYEIINKTNVEITQQFKQFLKENEMENLKNFTIQDMLALKTIPETISKMEELLEQFKHEFIKNFGSYSREKTLINLYDGYSTLKYKSKDYYLIVGFFWWWENVEIPYFGLHIRLPKKRFENSDIIKIFKDELVKKNSWEFEEDEIFSKTLPISDFISPDEECIPAMKEYVFENLKTLYNLKKKFPALLKK